jgi:hypothetical protein
VPDGLRGGQIDAPGRVPPVLRRKRRRTRKLDRAVDAVDKQIEDLVKRAKKVPGGSERVMERLRKTLER